MMVTDIALYVVFIGLIAFGVWGLYMLVKLPDKVKEANDEEAPYKLETPDSVAVSGFGDAPVKHEDRDLHKLLENWGSPDERKPKRKYTKRKTAAKKKVRKHRGKQNRKLK